MFEEEVNMQTQFTHPCITTINAAFYEGQMAYIEMPHYPAGSLADWLHSKPNSTQIQSVFRKILQGIEYLYDRGLVLVNLKFEDILMQSNGIPVISDFGVTGGGATSRDSIDTTVDLHREAITRPPENNTDCGIGTTMWTIGAMIYKAHFGSSYVVERGIPEHENKWLVSFLKAVFQKIPKLRLTPAEALVHPYFINFEGEDINLALGESDAKIESFLPICR